MDGGSNLLSNNSKIPTEKVRMMFLKEGSRLSLLWKSSKEKICQHIKHDLELSGRHCSGYIVRIESKIFQGFDL